MAFKKISTRIGKANRVLSELCCSMFTKWVHLITAKLLVFKLVYAPIFTCAHESCLLTGRLLSQVQAAEMTFLRRSHCVTRRDKVRSSETRKTLNVDPIFRIQRSQLQWCDQVTRIPKKDWQCESCWLHPPHGKRPRCRQMTRWCDCVSDFAWSCFGVEGAELSETAANMRYFEPLGAASPRPPSQRKSKCEMNESINQTYLLLTIFTLGFTIVTLQSHF